MKTTTFKVSIGDRSTTVRVPLEEDGLPQSASELRETARQRACEKMYGSNTFWWANYGLFGYGQVMRRCKNDTFSTSVTSIVRLDITMDTAEAKQQSPMALTQ